MFAVHMCKHLRFQDGTFYPIKLLRIIIVPLKKHWKGSHAAGKIYLSLFFFLSLENVNIYWLSFHAKRVTSQFQTFIKPTMDEI